MSDRDAAFTAYVRTHQALLLTAFHLTGPTPVPRLTLHEP